MLKLLKSLIFREPPASYIRHLFVCGNDSGQPIWSEKTWSKIWPILDPLVSKIRGPKELSMLMVDPSKGPVIEGVFKWDDKSWVLKSEVALEHVLLDFCAPSLQSCRKNGTLPKLFFDVSNVSYNSNWSQAVFFVFESEAFSNDEIEKVVNDLSNILSPIAHGTRTAPWVEKKLKAVVPQGFLSASFASKAATRLEIPDFSIIEGDWEVLIPSEEADSNEANKR